MKSRSFILFMGISLLSLQVSFGYWEDYPPYKFKEAPPVHLNVKPLVSGEGDYDDGSVVVNLKEPKPFEVEFSIKAGKTMLVLSLIHIFRCRRFGMVKNSRSYVSYRKNDSVRCGYKD